ncbi:MAG: hypothetical protein J6T92_04800 [Ottowia sp.]|nr:hypothetical protein [Ottowia sp.]
MATHPEYAFKNASTNLGATPATGGWFEAKLGDLTSTPLNLDTKTKLGEADIVVLVVSGADTIADYDYFKSLMETRSDKTFILFANSNAGNTNKAPGIFTDTIKSLTGWKDAHLTHVPSSSYTSIPFQGSKALADIFTRINKDAQGNDTSNLHGNTYGVIQCVPKDNVLYGISDKRCVRSRFDNSVAYVASNTCYTNTGDGGNMLEDLEQYPIIYDKYTSSPTPLPAATATALAEHAVNNNTRWRENTIKSLHPDSASSLLVPQWQSNGGKGACIMFTVGSIFDRQGKPACPSSGPTTDIPEPCHSPNDFAHSIFDHWSQLVPMAEAFLKAAVDKAACLQDKPAESVLAPAYNGASTGELAITVDGKVEGNVSDNRDKESVLKQDDGSGTMKTVAWHDDGRSDFAGNFILAPGGSTSPAAPSGVCPTGSEKCLSLGHSLNYACCTTVLPNDLPKSCSTAYMYCKAVSTSQAFGTDVCCSEDKTAQNSAGNLCCDADNPQPTGAPGSQICCKAGQINEGGKCATPPTPTPICEPPKGCSDPSAPTTGWPALLGLGALLPLLAARRRRRD